MKKTGELLKEEGRAYFIYPEKRREDFLEEMERCGLRARRFRSVLPRKDEPPHFFLVECGFFSGKPEVLTPFILYNEAGVYSEEAQDVFSGRVSHG